MAIFEAVYYIYLGFWSKVIITSAVEKYPLLKNTYGMPEGS